MQMHRSRRSLKDPAREGLAPCGRPNASLNCYTVYLLTWVRSPCLPNLAVYPELKPENNTSHFKAKVLNSKIIINNNILFYPYVSAVLLRLGRYQPVQIVSEIEIQVARDPELNPGNHSCSSSRAPRSRICAGRAWAASAMSAACRR